MKKSRILALLLALAMMFALAACGGGSTTTEAPKSETPATEAPATEAPQEEPAEEPAGDAIDPLTIKFSSTFQETETGGVILKHFMDKVSELSGGAITVNMTWGATLFDTMAELDAVADGAVDMVALGHMPHTGTLNYLGFPGFAPGGTQGALDYFTELMFTDPVSAPLVQEEAEAYGIKYLNVIAGGANALCASFEFTDLDSMIRGSAAFGNFSPAQWEALGFQVTALAPPDMYDGLNRGLVDSTQMGFAPMVAMSWFEVAPYWALDGTYTAGNPLTVNLNWWNGLTAAQQEIIEAAAQETQDYSAGIYDDAIAGDVATVEEATGNKFVDFNQADLDRLWKSCFDATADGALANAEKTGKYDNMVAVLEVAARITNYNWEH